jgi:hypothetical protein
MCKKFPIPGDLIIVDKSAWYGLSDGGKLRVCEGGGWFEEGAKIRTAPRAQVNTFWGPDHGPPDGIKPEHMSTSGGPFKSIPLEELEGIELIGTEVDRFWCWVDRPRAAGGMDRMVEINLWRLPLLIDAHYRNCLAYGIKLPRGGKNG